MTADVTEVDMYEGFILKYEMATLQPLSRLESSLYEKYVRLNFDLFTLQICYLCIAFCRTTQLQTHNIHAMIYNRGRETEGLHSFWYCVF